jgi:Transcriptional regulatory protein, C terminal
MQLEDIPRVAPPVLAVYGQNSESEALADELVLDGYDVRLIGDPAQLGEVDRALDEHHQQRDRHAARVRGRSRRRDPSTVRLCRAACARARASTQADRRDAAGDTAQGADDPHGHAHGPLWIDPGGAAPTRYALLVYLARDPTRVFTRAELLRGVWGYPSQDATRTLDSHASRLRCKLAKAGASGWVPATWGVGYCLAPTPRQLTGGEDGRAVRT